MNEMIAIAALFVTISGLSDLDHMSSKTGTLMRISMVTKTCGATLLAIFHIAMLVIPSVVLDDSVPVLLYLVGSLIFKVADRRRREQCEAGECPYRDGNSQIGKTRQ